MGYSDFLVPVDELQRHLQDPEWRVVDCRFELTNPDKGRADYLAGHIPGAVYAHLDRDLAAPVTPSSGRHPLPAPAAFADTLGRMGIAEGSTVVVYDQAGGAIAARLWWMLCWMGHGAARLLDGGMAAWQRAGLPLEQSEPRVRRTTYSGKADAGRVVSTADILAAVAAAAPLKLVDARDATRFEGKTEPIDPIAGHVPGAQNFPFSTSLAPDGTWRSPEELRQAWSSLADPPEAAAGGAHGAWAAMCGSGVTACHLAISAGLAGLSQPRLYAGSWSEWIRDPARPVACGAADAEPT